MTPPPSAAAETTAAGGDRISVAASKPVEPLAHRDVFTIALPIMISNATTPLVGLVDTMVIGQTGAAHLMGGVAVGALIFSVLYWTFSFLRMGTTGLTAQAFGAGDRCEVAAHLWRAVAVAVGLGLAIVALQEPILTATLWAIAPSSEVGGAVGDYYGWRVQGAPAGLVNFALVGWFIGLGRAGLAVAVQLLVNGINVALALLLTLVFDWGVEGVGIAALTAEVTGAIVGLGLAVRELGRIAARASRAEIMALAGIARMLAINRDITLRSLAAFAAQIFFTRQGAKGGDVTLAANAALITLNHVAIYLLDGFAHAAETLVGHAIGAKDRARYRAAVWLTTVWAGWLSIALSTVLWFAGPALIDAMTTSAEVRAAARIYLPWAALVPLVGVWCFQLDGIFIGATRTADMRNMMALSMVFFFAAWWLLSGFANHGLWASFLLLYAARALTLLIRLPALERHWFDDAAGAHGPSRERAAPVG